MPVTQKNAQEIFCALFFVLFRSSGDKNCLCPVFVVWHRAQRSCQGLRPPRQRQHSSPALEGQRYRIGSIRLLFFSGISYQYLHQKTSLLDHGRTLGKPVYFMEQEEHSEGDRVWVAFPLPLILEGLGPCWILNLAEKLKSYKSVINTDSTKVWKITAKCAMKTEVSEHERIQAVI